MAKIFKDKSFREDVKSLIELDKVPATATIIEAYDNLIKVLEQHLPEGREASLILRGLDGQVQIALRALGRPKVKDKK